MSEQKDASTGARATGRPAQPATSAAPALRRVMEAIRTLHDGLRQCGRAYRAIHAPVPPALRDLINQSNQRLAILRGLDEPTRARAIHLWHTTALDFDGAVLRATRERLMAATGMPREDCLRVAMGDNGPLYEHETKRLCEEATRDR